MWWIVILMVVVGLLAWFGMGKRRPPSFNMRDMHREMWRAAKAQLKTPLNVHRFRLVQVRKLPLTWEEAYHVGVQAGTAAVHQKHPGMTIDVALPVYDLLCELNEAILLAAGDAKQPRLPCTVVFNNWCCNHPDCPKWLFVRAFANALHVIE